MIDTNHFAIFGISPYYFFTGLGLLFAFGFYILFISYSGKDVNKNAIILFLSFIGLFLGAVAFGYITNLCVALYNQIPLTEVLKSGAGIVFYGGLTGFIITFVLLQKKFNKSIDKTVLNIFSTSIPLFHTFARIGCFFSGCCYGKNIDSFMSVDYILRGTTEAIRVFPVQLVEAGLNLVLFFVLCYILVKQPKRNILPVYLSTYATYRFILEFLRGDPKRGVFGLPSFSQIYSLLILLVLVILKFRGERKNEII